MSDPTSPLAPPPAAPKAHLAVGNTVPDRLAFLLSAVLSPYLVIPIGSLGIIYARSDPGHFWLFAAISIFFSTVAPALYVLWCMKNGTITDVHVMEREQRGGPFAVAIAGAVLSALLLWYLKAPASIWGLSVILALNGLAIYFITTKTKISVHVSVLSATVLGATILHPAVHPFALVWMIPALMWARWKRGRHTVWQGLGGCFLASVLTGGVILAIGQGERISQFFQRIF